VEVVPWLVLGLAAALGDSIGDVVTKRYFAHLTPYGMALARLLGAIPFLVLAALWLTLPPLTSAFWLIVAAMLPLETAAMLLYMRAIRVCQVSLCIPFLAFTPVFLILTGWLILGESLSRGGIMGTAMIAAGSYILGLGLERGARPGLLAPLKALAREKGAIMMLGVAGIYSVNAALYKAAILHSGPSFFGVAYPLLFTGFMGAGYPWFRVRLRPTLEAHWGWWLAMGFCFALTCLCLANGMELAPAAYLVAVKRLSLLLTVLLGGLWLQERPFLPRVLGAILMCAGVAVIALTH
jgi:drug/metabolite transporter (DMT)-like permease